MHIHTQTGQRVDAVNVHGAAAADALATTPPEGQGRVDLVLDADERIEHHGAGLVQVELVRLHLGLRGGLVGVPAVDVERLQLRILGRRGLLDRRRLAFGDDGSRSIGGNRLAELGDGIAGLGVAHRGEAASEDSWADGGCWWR
jgi:hypothetical protein